MPVRLLVYTHAAGYVHESTPAGVRALSELGFPVDAPAVFPDDLDAYGAVVFLNTSGTVLDASGRAALQAFLRSGRGFVGVHGAANTEYDWPWYGELLGGAWFDRHPDVQPATVTIEDPAHPATAHLAPQWTLVDEWYDFHANPRDVSRVLMTVDEKTYSGGGMGADHPVTWCRGHDGGRVFYTALGHTADAYGDAAFQGLLAGGIRWASGLSD